MSNSREIFNHLKGEKSPYLLQHAQNPVDWYPWGTAAFDKARLEDKPILLSIGYSTCHWCHVMAHESFEDSAIAKIINEHFVAVKVDREERPDIDQIYMTAVTAMTGQGGWPLTVFMTDQGHPFYGGTYFPPHAKWGSAGFIDLLHSIAAAWQKDREEILSSGRSITEMLKSAAPPPGVGMGLEDGMGTSLLEKAFGQMSGQFDPANGGFGSAPKFPMAHGLSFLLRYHQSARQPQALEMVIKTLVAMYRGGIWDHLGGGFHRYSTDPYWHVPHFEKMLYDQALLAKAYLEAYQVTQDAGFAGYARKTLDYVLREMTDPLGGFYSAQDADSAEISGGTLKEGAFYIFTQEEIEGVLGKETAAIFNYCYGVLPDGNAAYDPHGEFKGKNILYLAHTMQEAAAAALKINKPLGDIIALLEQAAAQMLAFRQTRPRPHRDEKVLCDWNGLMIATMAFAGRVLEEERYVKAASKAADFILSRMTAQKRLLHRWAEGEAGITATLSDYSFFIDGLLETYEATFSENYLHAAQNLADDMIKNFGDPQGGFYMTASHAEALIVRPKEVYDGAIPSGNSAAALVLLKLHALTKNDIYMTQAQALFGCFAPLAAQAPYGYSFLLSALDWYGRGPLDITFEGAGDNPLIAKMIKLVYNKFVPYKVLRFVPSSQKAQALICYKGTCKAPINSAEIFEREIAEVLKDA